MMAVSYRNAKVWLKWYRPFTKGKRALPTQTKVEEKDKSGNFNTVLLTGRKRTKGKNQKKQI